MDRKGELLDMKRILLYAFAVVFAAILAYYVQTVPPARKMIFGEENRLYQSVLCMAHAAEKNCSAAQVISAFCTVLTHD